MTTFPSVMPFERELRRWTRLRPEILTRCRVRIIEPHAKTQCVLLDLSPGGAGIHIPNKNWHAIGGLVQVEISFKGQPVAVRAAEVRRNEPQGDGVSVGLAWRMVPEPWNGIERRDRIRLNLPSDALFARIPLRHAHNVWTRLSVIDANSDFGFQVETRGGPAYLLPGHRAELRLDLPRLHQHGWDCQILWVRPTQGQNIRIGMRVLDPDPALEEIISEWLQIRREWSPVVLKNLGFGKESLPGQYRFRKVEELAENVSIANFLEDMSRRSLRTGMEPLHASDKTSTHETMQLGCWDGRKLVAAITLVPHIDELIDDTHSMIANFAIEPNWIVPEVFVGLWEQVVRLFLASGNSYLWVWCPPGREELFRLAGLDDAFGPELPEGIGTWMNIHRNRLAAGLGMNSIRWAILYGGVSGFVLKHQSGKLSLPALVARWRKLAFFGLLRDWREPREKRKLRRVVNDWSSEILENAANS